MVNFLRVRGRDPPRFASRRLGFPICVAGAFVTPLWWALLVGSIAPKPVHGHLPLALLAWVCG
jgi:hypothetical protein